MQPLHFGHYSSSAGTSNFQACLPGFYASMLASTSCTVCLSGTFSEVFGANSLMIYKNCTVGTFNSLQTATSNASCSACSAGTYSAIEGSSSCTLCPIGMYVETIGHHFLAVLILILKALNISTMSIWFLCVKPNRCFTLLALSKSTYLHSPGAYSSAQCVDCPKGT